MKKKIFGLIALLIIGSGVYLWWLGNRTVLTEAQKAEEARQLEIKQAQETRRRMEEQIRAVSTSTLQTIVTAIQTKKEPLAKLNPVDIAKASYTLAELKLADRETSSSRQVYQTSLKKIITAYGKGLPGNETEATLSYLETRATSTLKIITDSDQNLRTTLTGLAKLSVPASASFLHLQLLNSLASLEKIIYNMSQVASEPLLATSSADLRIEKYTDVIAAISSLDRYFQNPIISK